MSKKSPPAKKPDVRREVDRIERRVADAESVQRWMIHVTNKQLQSAERLRKLALACVNAKRPGRRAAATARLSAFVNAMTAFPKPLKLTAKLKAMGW